MSIYGVVVVNICSYIFSKQNDSRNVDRLAADLVRKCQHLIDINCGPILLPFSTKSVHIIRQQIGTINQAKLAEQNLMTEKSSRLCCFYEYLNCDVIATEKSLKITFFFYLFLK